MPNNDNYFHLPGVSNSDLTALKNELSGRELPDMTDAFRFGTLIDAMITEPHRIDWWRKLIDGEPVEPIEWNKAKRMYDAFRNNNTCKSIIASAIFQKVSQTDRLFDWNGLEFWLPVRCKWDFFGHISGDIKSTAATTQKQFEAACQHFDYYRSRAWYMDIEKTNRDVIIGISKVNYKIFFVKIERGDANHTQGVQDYTDLALKWWVLKGDYILNQN